MQPAAQHLHVEGGRFVVAGAFVTALSAAVYSLAAVMLRMEPVAAAVVGHIAGVLAGFRIHAHWTFRRPNSPGFDENLRFVIASLSPLALNACWAFLLVNRAGLGSWAPIVPMVMVTPLLTFAINRAWVFRAA